MVRRSIFALSIVLVLAACSSGGVNNKPLPTVVLENHSSASGTPAPAGSASIGGVSASGVVEAVRDASLAFLQSGNVESLNVSIGDAVKEGQVLAELDNAAEKAQYSQAEQQLREMTSVAAVAAAEQDLAEAQKDLKDKKDKVNSLFYKRASDTLIDNTQADIDLAKKDLTLASDQYSSQRKKEDGDPEKAAALLAMTNAQLRLNELQAKMNWYTGKPSDEDAAIARANYDAAIAAVQEATWYLAAVKGGTVPAEATGSKLASLEKARNDLTLAKSQLEGSQLIAPFDGIVADISFQAGDFISPGVVQMVVIDPSQYKIITTDLSEMDVAKVSVGQSVDVFVKAIGQTVPGVVESVSSAATTLGGDVVYRTVIRLKEIPEGLKSGMSADVQYLSD